jgi:hypothetical protein
MGLHVAVAGGSSRPLAAASRPLSLRTREGSCGSRMPRGQGARPCRRLSRTSSPRPLSYQTDHLDTSRLGPGGSLRLPVEAQRFVDGAALREPAWSSCGRCSRGRGCRDRSSRRWRRRSRGRPSPPDRRSSAGRISGEDDGTVAPVLGVLGSGSRTPALPAPRPVGVAPAPSGGARPEGSAASGAGSEHQPSSSSPPLAAHHQAMTTARRMKAGSNVLRGLEATGPGRRFAAWVRPISR